MLCNQLLDGRGKPSRLYHALLEKNGGNEEKALDEWIRLTYGNDVRYQLGDSPLNELFLRHDRYTEEEEENFRARGWQDYIRKTRREGTDMWEFTDSFGRRQYVEMNKLDEAIDSYVKSRRSFSNGFGERFKELLAFYPKSESEKELKEQMQELFGNMPPQAFYAFIDGLYTDKIKGLDELQEKPYYDSDLAEEKIFIHEDEGMYNLLLPTPSNKHSAYPGHSKFSFMKRFFANDIEARRKGFTIDGNMEGRKELAAALLAVRIKMHDSKARFESARFASLNGNGESFDMDLHRGVNNLLALARSREYSHVLPADIKEFLLSGKVNPGDFEGDYVAKLMGRVTALSERSPAHAEMLRYMQTGDRHDRIKAVSKRMFWLQRNKPDDYQKMDTPYGKEYYLLAKSLEQLKLDHGGIDRRALNTHILINDNFISKGLKNTVDIANQTISMVMQDLQRYLETAKHYYIRSYLPARTKALKKFLKNKAVGGKQRVLNDSEDYYKNLFERKKLRIVKDGKLTGESMEAQTLSMKNPDDMSNGLQPYEREFIREVVGLMRTSIERFIDKRIDDGVLTNYKSGKEWYEEHYKTQELLLPVLRKDFLTKLFDGGIKNLKEGLNEAIEENIDNLVVAIGRNLDWGATEHYGVATSQRGGMYGSRERLQKLGLADHNGELVVINPRNNRSASIDVEKIMDYSSFMNEKMRFERELQTTYQAAKVILKHNEQRKGKEARGEHAVLDHLFHNLVNAWRDETIVSGNRNVTATVDAARAFSGMATLTGNVGSIFLSFMGNNVALATTALAKRYGDHFFTMKDVRKTIAAIAKPQGLKKFNDLIDLFLFHETDEVNLLFSDKFKEGQKGFIKSRYGMLPHSLIDRMTRGMILVSQLNHDGLYENFEYDKEGRIFYNWEKDRRGKELKNTIVRNQEALGREPLPYDDLMQRTLTTIAARMFGSYTDNDKAFYQTVAMGQAFMQFKGYIAGRVKDLYTEGFDNTNIQWYETDESGKVKTWVFYQEGILQSFVAAAQELQKNRNLKELKPEQVANLRKLAFDMAIFALAGIAYMGVRGLDDEEEKKKGEAGTDKRSLLTYMGYAWMDVVGTYNASEYFTAIGTPVFISYFQKAAAATWNYMTFDFDNATRQTINLYGPAKTTRQAINFFGQ